MCESEKGVLENLFESREEELCALTEIDRQKIKRLTRNNLSKLKNLIIIIKDVKLYKCNVKELVFLYGEHQSKLKNDYISIVEMR